MKRLLAILLCLCMLAVLIPAHSAAASVDCDCGEIVHVWIDGFGQALFYDEGTPEESRASKSDTSNLARDVLGLFPGVLRSVVAFSWEPFIKALSEILLNVMVYYRLDENGVSAAPITSHWILDPEQDHETNPKYSFRYDFRMDPFDIAEQLDDFIETLCAQTGHSKIALTGCSEGAVVAMAYLKEYGSKGRLDSLLIVNGSWQGLTLVGQLLTKQFEISGPGLTNYLANEADDLMIAGMDLLRTSRLLNFLPGLCGLMMRTLGDPIYANAIMPLFGHMPAIWAFVPDEYYEGAIQAMLGSDPKYDGLRARIDRYHYGVMMEIPALLEKAMAGGTKVSVVASYGLAPMPFTQDTLYQSDGFVDSAREAGGATYAPLGQTLPPSGSEYRSPDGVFDAATCILPDQTWFIKYNSHSAGCMGELIDWILHSQAQPTVWQNPAFPQYLRRTQDGRAVPLGDGPEPAPVENFFEACRIFVRALG